MYFDSIQGHTSTHREIKQNIISKHGIGEKAKLFIFFASILCPIKSRFIWRWNLCLKSHEKKKTDGAEDHI